MQGIFRKENTDKALKYGIYRHLPTYEKIIRNLVSFFTKNSLLFTVLKYTKDIPFEINLVDRTLTVYKGKDEEKEKYAGNWTISYLRICFEMNGYV